MSYRLYEYYCLWACVCLPLPACVSVIACDCRCVIVCLRVCVCMRGRRGGHRKKGSVTGNKRQGRGTYEGEARVERTVDEFVKRIKTRERDQRRMQQNHTTHVSHNQQTLRPWITDSPTTPNEISLVSNSASPPRPAATVRSKPSPEMPFTSNRPPPHSTSCGGIESVQGPVAVSEDNLHRKRNIRNDADVDNISEMQQRDLQRSTQANNSRADMMLMLKRDVMHFSPQLPEDKMRAAAKMRCNALFTEG